MKQQKIIFLLLVVAMILTIALTSGVGYATVSDFRNDDVITSPERATFRIEFYGKPSVSGDGTADVKFIGDTTARMNVRGLKKAGDSVIATFGIKNCSHDLGAILSKAVTNSNSRYFKVTATLSNDEISPRNGEVTLSIKVELIKTPIDSVEKTNICVRVIANPDYKNC